MEAYIQKISSASLVQITEFTVTDQEYAGFVFYDGNVTVTVQNFGTSDVDGLTLWIEDTTVEGGLNETIQLGTVKVGEPQTIKVKLHWDLQRDLVATLMLDDMYPDVLKEADVKYKEYLNKIIEIKKEKAMLDFRGLNPNPNKS